MNDMKKRYINICNNLKNKKGHLSYNYNIANVGNLVWPSIVQHDIMIHYYSILKE